jgi:signal transduction histidine kinase
MGFTTLLEESIKHEEPFTTYFNNIHKSGQDLLKLVEDTIDMAKIENNQVSISKYWKPFKDTVDDLYKQFKAGLNTDLGNIKFNYYCDPETPRVYTDHELLKKGISYILDNAFKFTEKGEIKFSVHLNGNNTIEIKIQDTGIGIPPEKQELVFNKFVKFERKDKLFRGNGLGLSIADWLVRSLNGKITLKSEVDKGSEFTVQLPIYKK